MQNHSVTEMWKEAVDKCREHLIAHGVATEGSTVLLAVSGGLDSMCMIYLLREIFTGIAIAHVNYNLRGEASNDDAMLVRSESARLGLQFHEKSIDLPAYLSESPGNLQSIARDMRYHWFAALQAENGYDFIATAHHMNDSVETFFVHLIRGTGGRGLSGIPVTRQSVIRPLMCFTREEIMELVKIRSVPFREDASNASEDYLRNRIRHNILPELLRESPDFIRDVVNVQERVGAEMALLDEYLDLLHSEIVTQSGNMLMLDRVRIMSTASPSLVLYSFLRDSGFSLEQCRQVISYEGQTGAKFMSQGCVCLVNRDELLLFSNSETSPQNVIELDHKSETILPGGKFIIEPVFDRVFDENENSEIIDRSKLNGVLRLRTWANGDFFYPLGGPGKQKLQDFFVNRKVALPDKNKIWLLTSGEDIVWVCGMRLDDRFKVTPDTREMIRLTWEPEIL